MKRAVVLGVVCLFLADGVSRGQQVPKKEDVPQLIKDLSAKDAKARLAACQGLGLLGQVKASYVRPAINQLCDVAKKDSDVKVRAEAVTALGLIDPDPEKAAPVLLGALKEDKDQGVQMAAVTALGNLGPGAKDALPLLKEINDKYRAEQAKAREERTKYLKDGDKEKAKAAQQREQAAGRWTQATGIAIKAISAR
jgi:HEAT repeat protein